MYLFDDDSDKNLIYPIYYAVEGFLILQSQLVFTNSDAKQSYYHRRSCYSQCQFDSQKTYLQWVDYSEYILKCNGSRVDTKKAKNPSYAK